MKIYFQFFDLILRHFRSFFWDFNGGSTKKDHLQMLVLKNLRKKWSSDESARPSTLKTGIHHRHFHWPIHKFQSSNFKEYPWKAATVLQKCMCFKNMLWNTECINLCFQFPKYRLVRCTKLSFYYMVYLQGGIWKKLLIDWNEYQENSTTISFKFFSPKPSR